MLMETGLLKGSIQHRLVLRAVAAQTVERPTVNECFEDPLVAETKVDAAAEVEDRRERRGLPGGDDRVDRAAPDVSNCAQPESHPAVADDREAVAGLIHVGGQDLQPQLT